MSTTQVVMVVMMSPVSNGSLRDDDKGSHRLGNIGEGDDCHNTPSKDQHAGHAGSDLPTAGASYSNPEDTACLSST